MPALVPSIQPDPDRYCHDCETADALDMAPWCDDARCRERRSGKGREERGVGRADPRRGESS